MSSPVSSPVAPAPAPRRPMGLVIAAIVLALMSCVGLLGGFFTLMGAVFVRTPQLAQYPVIESVQICLGIVVLLISAFCAWTVVGLFRVQKWARFSILFLGGLLAFFSFANAAIYLVLSFSSFASFATPPNAPGVSPLVMKAIFLGLAGFSLLFTLVGVWWLVYFNLRRTRAVFAMNGAQPFPELLSQGPAAVEGVWIDPNKPKRSVIELLVICLAVLYFFGALWGVIEAFVRFPLFFLGFIFRGNSASVVGLVMAAIDIGLGIGLLRRMKPAWAVALAFNALGLVYMLFMLTPHYRATFADYQQEMFRHTFSGAFPYPPPNQLMMGPILIVSAIFGCLMVGAVFWLLIRARPLFEQKETAS